MTETIKLFLPNEFFEELLYQYEGKDSDLRKMVFGFLTPLGKQGKLALLSKSIQVRIMKGDKMEMENRDLADIDLEATAVKSNERWIPEKVTKEEIKIYELSISDRLYKDLESFGKIYCARLKIYNDTLDTKAPDYKEKLATLPSCFEQILQDNVVGNLSNQIASGIEKEYEEEFAELEKKIPTPPKR
jgi:hypothetical protein